MSAAAAAAKTPRNEIEFRKYPVVLFFVIMNAFNQVSTPARKRIFFFPVNKLVEVFKAVCAETVVKSIRQKRFGSIA